MVGNKNIDPYVKRTVTFSIVIFWLFICLVFSISNAYAASKTRLSSSGRTQTFTRSIGEPAARENGEIAAKEAPEKDWRRKLSSPSNRQYWGEVSNLTAQDKFDQVNAIVQANALDQLKLRKIARDLNKLGVPMDQLKEAHEFIKKAEIHNKASKTKMASLNKKELVNNDSEAALAVFGLVDESISSLKLALNQLSALAREKNLEISHDFTTLLPIDRKADGIQVGSSSELAKQTANTSSFIRATKWRSLFTPKKSWIRPLGLAGLLALAGGSIWYIVENQNPDTGWVDLPW